MKHIAIIGNGISGITAARHIRKQSHHRITVISSETDHFFSRTALMYVYMGHMKYEHTKPYEEGFWKKNKIELLRDHVIALDTSAKSLSLKSGNMLHYDVLIIASGSRSNTVDWPGLVSKGVQTLYSLQDLELLEHNTKGIGEAVIVGGGLIGIEMAEMLLSRKINITWLIREPEFWSNVLPMREASLISRHIREHHVQLHLNTELKEIIPDHQGRVKEVVTSHNDTIPCQFAGITIGVSPNIDFIKSSSVAVSKGILVNAYLQTNVADVYAIGDCVERSYALPGRTSIEQVWYTGRMMGEVVAQTICGRPTQYSPGPWFNSAKFFEIEYQTYGTVPHRLGIQQEDFYWEHDSGKKAIHVVWDKSTRILSGINAFGIRLRHETFDRWLREKKTVDHVMEHLPEANFDPEFFPRHEKEIVKAFIPVAGNRSSVISVQ